MQVLQWLVLLSCVSSALCLSQCEQRLDVLQRQYGYLKDYSSDRRDRAVLLYISQRESSDLLVLHTEDRRTFLSADTNPLKERHGTELIEFQGLSLADIKLGPYRKYSYIAIMTSGVAVAELRRHMSNMNVINGSIWTAGTNTYGNLGHHQKDDRSMFSKVQGLGRVKQVATGTHHMAVLTLDGKIYTWGRNHRNQLGVYTRNEDSVKPLQVNFENGVSPKEICCGGYFCVVRTENEVLTWGKTENLGRPSIGTSEWTPGRVRGLEDVKIAKIICGESHSFAVTDQGRLFGWGGNYKSVMTSKVSEKKPYATEIDLGTKRYSASTITINPLVIYPRWWTALEIRMFTAYVSNFNAGYKHTQERWRIIGFDNFEIKIVSDLATGNDFTIIRTTDNKTYYWGYDYTNFVIKSTPTLTSLDFPRDYMYLDTWGAVRFDNWRC